MESILDISYEIVEDESGNIIDNDDNPSGEDIYYINPSDEDSVEALNNYETRYLISVGFY